MDPASIGGKRASAMRQSQRPKGLTAIQSYRLAVFGVALALGVALLFQRFHFRDVEVPLFLFALAIAAWYGGFRAAVLAWVLSCLSFDYFFVEPLYSVAIAGNDLPYFFVFALFAALVTWFSTVRRRVERELLQARDDIEKHSAELAASNKELEAFAYSVSHDLRAPLRHMAGFSGPFEKNSPSVFTAKKKTYNRGVLELVKTSGDL